MERKRRSEHMEAEELRKFRKVYGSYTTKTDAAAFFGLSRQVLDGVFLKGSGAPESVEKIRSVIGVQQGKAA